MSNCSFASTDCLGRLRDSLEIRLRLAWDLPETRLGLAWDLLERLEAGDSPMENLPASMMLLNCSSLTLWSNRLRSANLLVPTLCRLVQQTQATRVHQSSEGIWSVLNHFDTSLLSCCPNGTWALWCASVSELFARMWPNPICFLLDTNAFAAPISMGKISSRRFSVEIL